MNKLIFVVVLLYSSIISAATSHVYKGSIVDNVTVSLDVIDTNIAPRALWLKCEDLVKNDRDVKNKYESFRKNPARILSNSNSLIKKDFTVTLEPDTDTQLIKDLKSKYHSLFTLPNITSQDLINVEKEAKNAFKFQQVFLMLKEKFANNPKALDVLNSFSVNVRHTLFFLPTMVEILEKNKEVLMKKSLEVRPNHTPEIFLTALFQAKKGLSNAPLHTDFPHVDFIDWKNSKNILTYTFAITDFLHQGTQLLISPKEAGYPSYSSWTKETMLFVRKELSKVIGRKTTDDDLLKIKACSLSDRNFSSYPAFVHIILLNHAQCLHSNKNTNYYYASGIKGEGYFLQPFRNCHTSSLINTGDEDRISTSTRILTAKEVQEIYDFNTPILYEGNRKVLDIIFGISGIKLSSSSGYLCTNSKNKECTTKEEFNKFFQLDNVKRFFNVDYEDYNKKIFPQIIKRLENLSVNK